MIHNAFANLCRVDSSDSEGGLRRVYVHVETAEAARSRRLGSSGRSARADSRRNSDSGSDTIRASSPRDRHDIRRTSRAPSTPTTARLRTHHESDSDSDDSDSVRSFDELQSAGAPWANTSYHPWQARNHPLPGGLPIFLLVGLLASQLLLPTAPDLTCAADSQSDGTPVYATPPASHAVPSYPPGGGRPPLGDAPCESTPFLNLNRRKMQSLTWSTDIVAPAPFASSPPQYYIPSQYHPTPIYWPVPAPYPY